MNRKDQEENAAGGEVKELVTWFCDLSASQAPSFRSHSHKSKLQVKVTITGHSDRSSQSQSYMSYIVLLVEIIPKDKLYVLSGVFASAIQFKMVFGFCLLSKSVTV